MRKTMHAAAAFSAAMIAGLALSGCPMQPTYPSTITPIYAATSTGLAVFNGTGWTSYPFAGANAVVVSGSGSGAIAYVGGAAGVSQFDGTAWTALTGGLGAATVNRLFLSSSLYAATSGGVSILNGAGPPWWTNNNAVTSANDVFSFGTYTFVAANAGLYIYNGANLVSTYVPSTTVLPTSTKVQSVFVDTLGDVIAGTDKGLAVLNSGATSFGPNLLPPNTSVSQITMDQNGNLYAATSGGLYIIGTSAVLALPGNITCVCVDGAGTIYVGTGTAAGLRVSKNNGSTWTTQLAAQTVNSVTTTAPLYSF